MKIGVPKEILTHEYRVGLVPGSVGQLIDRGHTVLIECGAGEGIGCADEDYERSGATLVDTAAGVFAGAELIIKVKEPQSSEIGMLRAGQVLFTYLHLAADRGLTDALCDSGITAIAYETVTADDGSLPLLAPMSAVAGRMSIQAGAMCLQRDHGGAGILLAGVHGVAPAHVTIIGGGVVGTNAAEMAVGLRADVTILDRSPERLEQLERRFDGRVRGVVSTAESIAAELREAHLVVGAVLIPGARAPRLVTREMLSIMNRGGVLVDVSIDQGGCFETSRPTTLADPTYVVEGIVHYCVRNMPGAVPRTSAFALNNATLPFVIEIADRGLTAAIADDRHLGRGVNVRDGRIVHEAVADAFR